LKKLQELAPAAIAELENGRAGENFLALKNELHRISDRWKRIDFENWRKVANIFHKKLKGDGDVFLWVHEIAAKASLLMQVGCEDCPKRLRLELLSIARAITRIRVD